MSLRPDVTDRGCVIECEISGDGKARPLRDRIRDALAMGHADRQNRKGNRMTRKAAYLSGALALTLGLTATGAALAQGRDARGPAQQGPGVTFFVQQFDRDGDGAVTRAEIDAVRAERFAEADADGDGTLSQEEAFAAAEARRAEREALHRQARAAAMFNRLDTDGNGALSQEELAAATGPEQMFDRADRNDDGVLSAEEIEAVQSRFAGFHGKRGWHEGDRRHGPGERGWHRDDDRRGPMWNGDRG